VKGDVHDIGKNIVGIVLGCNNYDIIDLGVMTPADKILQTAREQKADIIGLSGLITPSLDEMVHVAKEMERLGFDLPLLIGGATTSKTHTAVKIKPEYTKGPTVHVLDASRAVAVVSDLLSTNNRDRYVRDIDSEYQDIRQKHLQRNIAQTLIPIDKARANRLPIAWNEKDIYRPRLTGIKFFKHYPLEEIRRRIDWTPFFQAWELKGKYPRIFDDPKVGEEARKLYDDAQELLDQIITNQWLSAHAVIGIFPANSIGDDIELYRDDTRKSVLTIFHTLRQQMAKGKDKYNLALADFVAPRDSGLSDYMGAFAVTAGIGLDDRVKQFEKNHDDYRAILAKALADRLAEALAERMHERVRRNSGDTALTKTSVTKN
jgi:5-methyltetrahydrofolate--homocysteine methyltransferase